MSQRMKMILGILGFTVLMIGAALAYNLLSEKILPDSGLTNGQQTQEKEKAPDFAVTDEEGNSYRLSELRGKPVVLNFWASWCPPCREEMPDFDKLCAELGDEVQFMMVDCVGGSETVQSGARFIREQGYEFPVFFDTAGEAAAAYGISGIPATYFIDAEGNLASGRVGMLSAQALRDGIESIRGQR